MHPKTEKFFSELEQGVKPAAILIGLALTPEEHVIVKREISSELGLGAKPKDPALIKAEALKVELEKDDNVQMYVETVTTIKKLRGRNIEPGWLKYNHDETYAKIQLHDGRILDTTKGSAWKKEMQTAGYRQGQINMVSKGIRESETGKSTYKNTIITS